MIKKIEIIIDEENNRFKLLNKDNIDYHTIIMYLADAIVNTIHNNYMGNKIEFLENLLEPMKQDLISLDKENK
jgi:hypothetical protein